MADKPEVVPGNPALGFDADVVVHGGSNALLAAEVSLGRLNRDVPEEELDVIQRAILDASERLRRM